MRMKLLFSILFVGCLSSATAQETNGGKKMYARSVLNQKAPELVVQEWLTKRPDTRGKFVLIDFSATWCHACRKAMPELNEFQKNFPDKLVVIFITKENAAKVKAAKNFLVEVASAVDTTGSTSSNLEVKGIPHNILIDPKGYVRWEGFPASKDFELNEEVLTSIFEKYGPDAGKTANLDATEKVVAEGGLHGPVKLVTETSFTSTDKQGIVQKGAGLYKKISEYDRKGNLVEQRFFNANDTLLTRALLKFDARGNMTERSGYDAKGDLFSRTVFTYDGKGNLTGEQVFTSDGSLDSKTACKHDAGGKLTEEILFNNNKKTVYKSVYRYNPAGKLLEKVIYDNAGNISSRYTADYDTKGRKIKDYVFGADKSLLHKYISAYGAKGNKITDKVFDASDKLSSVYTYTYDSANQLTEEKVTYPDGKLVVRYAFKYDDKGRLAGTFRYDPGGELYLQSDHERKPGGDQLVWDYYNQGKLSTRFVNTYENKDKMGNWLKRIKIANKHPSGYTEREIQYYTGNSRSLTNIQASEQPLESYSIHGTTDVSEGYAVLDAYSKRPDSAKIRNGRFEFKGTVTGPKYQSIQVAPGRVHRMILEPGDITVHFSKETGYDIGGTPNNKRLDKMDKTIRPYYDRVAALWKSYNAAQGEERARLFNETEDAREALAQKQRELIKEDSNYSGFLTMLPTYRNESADVVKGYLEQFSALSEDENYERVAAYYRGAAQTVLGIAPPDWTRPDEKGNMITLSSLRNKYVLLDFWYAGCVWCRKMTPQLKKVYSDLKDKGLEVVSISVDTKENEDKWRKAMKEDGAPWLQAWDYEKTLPAQYGVLAYPTMFLLDKEGKVVEKIIGYREEPALRELFAKYIR